MNKRRWTNGRVEGEGKVGDVRCRGLYCLFAKDGRRRVREREKRATEVDSESVCVRARARANVWKCVRVKRYTQQELAFSMCARARGESA